MRDHGGSDPAGIEIPFPYRTRKVKEPSRIETAEGGPPAGRVEPADGPDT